MSEDLNALHLQRVVAQYTEQGGDFFYRCVMGDGGGDIHYGIYQDTSDTMQQATQRSSRRLLEIAIKKRHASCLAKDSARTTAFSKTAGGEIRSAKLLTDEILELGSGTGSTARWLARQTDCRVTCVDLCQQHSLFNAQQIAAEGLGDRVAVHTGMFERLPNSWSGRFDWVWSQEAICHARIKRDVYNEAKRVLKPSGIFVCSDILYSDQCPADALAAFTNVNAVIRLESRKTVEWELSHAGFIEVEYEDWSDQLPENFRRMLEQIEKHRRELITSGVSEDLIERFAEALRLRLTWAPGEVLCWGAFVCRVA
jgi:sarcosine/dimethylglycine N-methyltransferase